MPSQESEVEDIFHPVAGLNFRWQGWGPPVLDAWGVRQGTGPGEHFSLLGGQLCAPLRAVPAGWSLFLSNFLKWQAMLCHSRPVIH